MEDMNSIQCSYLKRTYRREDIGCYHVILKAAEILDSLNGRGKIIQRLKIISWKFIFYAIIELSKNLKRWGIMRWSLKELYPSFESQEFLSDLEKIR